MGDEEDEATVTKYSIDIPQRTMHRVSLGFPAASAYEILVENQFIYTL